MDFWDITKVLLRRWMIALPLLGLSALLTVAVVGRVKPDYIATAYVQLVPPILAQAPNQPTADTRNNWLSQGLQTIGNAAIVIVTDQTVIDELAAGGYSDTFTIEMGASTPLITFEVVGASEAQARQTAEQLVLRFNESIRNLQKNVIRSSDLITATRLDQGTNVKMSNGKLKRALVAVAGAGILLTAGVTVAIDAWLRRRRRRRQDAAADLLTPLRSGGGRQHDGRQHDGRRHAEPRQPAPPSTVYSGARANGEHTEVEPPTTPIPASSSRLTTPGTRLADVNVEYQFAAHPAQMPADQDGRDNGEPPAPPEPADATIVLPLSLPDRGQWPGRLGERKQHP